MALTTQIQIAITANYTLALDLVTKSAALIKTETLSLDNGTGLGQADVVFSDSRSTSGTDSLDLIGGGLLDNLGVTWAPARIKAIIVKASSANSGNVLLRRPASNGVPFLSAAGDEIPIHPGGIVVIFAPSAAGYAVTAGTGDLIDLVASAGTVAYDIYLVGGSV